MAKSSAYAGFQSEVRSRKRELHLIRRAKDPLDHMAKLSRQICFRALPLILLNGTFVLVVISHRRAAQVDPVAVFNNIDRGDTSAHAVALFRRPPGNYGSRSGVMLCESSVQRKMIKEHRLAGREMAWQFDEGEILLYANEDGVIVAKTMRCGVPRPRVFREVLRDTGANLAKRWREMCGLAAMMMLVNTPFLLFCYYLRRTGR